MTLDARTQAIINTLATIPEGKVTTYGQLAQRAGYPGNARLVGAILRKLPESSSLPWHRVINSHGKISFPETSLKYQQQQKRLEHEGIIFSNNTCSLNKYLW